MKLVVITDVHGNLPALQAVLNVVKPETYDHFIHLGDAIGIGPFPAECLQTLLAVPKATFLMGNHDAWFVNGLPHPQPSWMSDGEVAHQRWTHQQIPASLRADLQQWPYLIETIIKGVSITLLHYALKSSGQHFQRILPTPSPKALDALFAPHHLCDLLLYGHHHPFSDVVGQTRYINPGSLGCFSEPIARYTVIHCHQGQFNVEHHQVPYDDVPLQQAFIDRAVPEAAFLNKVFYGGRL